MSELEVLFKYNCSTIFLLYPLGLERKKLASLGFVDAYLFDSESETAYKNPVFLLFKPDSMTVFQAFVDSQYETPNKWTGTIDLVEDYDYVDGYVVLVYEFPKEFEPDYKKFMTGKYSTFSQKMKDTYPKFIKTKKGDVICTQYKVIYKSEDLKDLIEEVLDITFDPGDEIWKVYDKVQETLSYEKAKQLKGVI